MVKSKKIGAGGSNGIVELPWCTYKEETPRAILTSTTRNSPKPILRTQTSKYCRSAPPDERFCGRDSEFMTSSDVSFSNPAINIFFTFGHKLTFMNIDSAMASMIATDSFSKDANGGLIPKVTGSYQGVSSHCCNLTQMRTSCECCPVRDLDVALSSLRCFCCPLQALLDCP